MMTEVVRERETTKTRVAFNTVIWGVVLKVPSLSGRVRLG